MFRKIFNYREFRTYKYLHIIIAFLVFFLAFALVESNFSILVALGIKVARHSWLIEISVWISALLIVMIPAKMAMLYRGFAIEIEIATPVQDKELQDIV